MPYFILQIGSFSVSSLPLWGLDGYQKSENTLTQYWNWKDSERLQLRFARHKTGTWRSCFALRNKKRETIFKINVP
jgi:hypothetical protein